MGRILKAALSNGFHSPCLTSVRLARKPGRRPGSFAGWPDKACRCRSRPIDPRRFLWLLDYRFLQPRDGRSRRSRSERKTPGFLDEFARAVERIDHPKRASTAGGWYRPRSLSKASLLHRAGVRCVERHRPRDRLRAQDRSGFVFCINRSRIKAVKDRARGLQGGRECIPVSERKSSPPVVTEARTCYFPHQSGSDGTASSAPNGASARA